MFASHGGPLLFIIPIFVIPIVFHLIASIARKRRIYRFNDLVTNLSLSLLSTLSGLVILSMTYAAYAYVLKYHAIAHLETKSAITWFFGFLGYDFCYYWAHRAHHRVALLWASHVVHHSGEDFNFGLALRQSVTGQLTFWIFFIPLAFLGLPLEVYLSIAFVQLIYQFFIHNEFVGALGWLEYVLVTPAQHRIHHSRNVPYLDKNYGDFLVVWDRLFRTYARELPSEPPVYGSREQVRSWDPWKINFHQYVSLFQKMGDGVTFMDKSKAMFLAPEWMPVTARAHAGYCEVGSAAAPKYDPRIRASGRWYILYQFIALFAAFVGLLWYSQGLTPLAAIAGTAFVVSTAYMIGGLLDGKRQIWQWELRRQLLIVAMTLLLLSEGSSAWALYAIVAYASLGVALLSMFSFAAGAEQREPS